jgi:hyperosmotically inducible protein
MRSKACRKSLLTDHVEALYRHSTRWHAVCKGMALMTIPITRKPVRLIAVAAAIALALCGCDRVNDMRDGLPGDSSTRAETTPAQPAAPENAAPPPARVAAPAEPPSDAAITDRVQAGLHNDPALAGADVSVNTDHGVVHLAGLVKSQEQAAIATTHAQRQDGVMRVDSHLAVTPQ